MSRRCYWCGTEPRNGRCASCDLYNAAVDAQKAAAHSLATARHPNAKDAFLNEYGVMAWVGGVCKQVGSPDEAAPFARLTGEARKVRTDD